MAVKKSDSQYFDDWKRFRDNTLKSTSVDLNETASEKLKRIERLEKDPEEWFKYYFPNYYKCEPAPFHIKATKRVLKNPEWYEVRSWSRELAKSARTFMEVMFLCMTKQKRNILMVSATKDDAERLLLPYKTTLEVNQRIINDYGVQENYGSWESSEFITQSGISFRAIGARQSPRGTRNEEIRVDVILIDDFDTDQDCENKEIVQKKIEWCEQALFPTRSISEPLLILVCGNIIAKYCCVKELGKKADIHEIINIRDENGKSTWPNKNTEEMIDRVFRTMTTSSIQKEYFNNPIKIGKIFKAVIWGKCPPLNTCEKALIYSDPSTSNNTNTKSSRKSIGVIGVKNDKYYLYKIWLDNMTQSQFVEHLYSANDYVKAKKVDTFKTWIENNSLQDPFYQQVIKPLIKSIGRRLKKIVLFMSLDKRDKKGKYDRIEGTLEPIYKDGALIFNIDEKENPHMKRMEEEFVGVDESSKMMDGPDMLEGGVWILRNSQEQNDTTYSVGFRSNRKY